MKKINLLIISILLLTFVKSFAQDSITFKSNTKVVLDHLSELFSNQIKVIVMNSYFDENNIFYYNIYIVDKLSYAIKPQPLYYLKYRNIILIYKNYFYFIEHSSNYLEEYVNSIKNYVKNDITIVKFDPLIYHRINENETIIIDEEILYYCYKIENCKIISFNKTTAPFKIPCSEVKSFK